MIESDADRLEMIRAVGGVECKVNKGAFQAIFDNEFVESEAEPGVEGRQPVLTCRTSDVGELEIRKGSHVTIGAEVYRVQRHEPDGTGMSRLVLRK